MSEVLQLKKQSLLFRERWIQYIHALQNTICEEVEKTDGLARFTEDRWERPENGGGGKSRVITDGNVFEKGGVNTSVVSGTVSDAMRSQLKIEGSGWFACGLSLVIHPLNPFVPTVHANWRYFELYNEAGEMTDRWFGGGTDLTPYYLFKEDAVYFHSILKQTLDPFGSELYPKYKTACDRYFSNSHRNQEMRGIGGIFYDYLRPENEADAERLFTFQQANGNAFLKAYLPVVGKRKDHPFGENEIKWQEIRRGRYVEFNLIHDRGTLFGLKTNGRTESILMSLPPRARWIYNYQPEPGSREDELLQVCLHPVDWI
ncbi:MAG TPA: oxygen-dependent coproporphyrinogen oxidase [Chitinophagaceae bacterium]|jgi:coproporphyrinogen III oxidase|nr:oxygen-dependent coproporphyrinogen oxidase [Chitinophagaceae bacterium]